MINKIRILWADDEIDLLKIQILFLEKKGYEVITATNGKDAIDIVRDENFDIIFLDENMPGLTGLETLEQIKKITPSTPTVMITKNEEEDLMEEAIGSKIDDYLIKPVKPQQILLTIKKNIETDKIVSQKTTTAYQTEFGKLGMQINSSQTVEDWKKTYKDLIYWELELEKSKDNAMDEVLQLQKTEANSSFAKYVKNNYISWFDSYNDDKPLLSPGVFKEKVFPLLENDEKVVFILIDNLRFDQWEVLKRIISPNFNVTQEDMLCSILPTATQYSRNSIFSGLMPSEIEKLYPDLWLNDDEEGGKNLHEEDLLKRQMNRFGINKKFCFEKILNSKHGKKIVDNIQNLLQNDLIVLVYNFIDILSHARTDMEMIKELAKDESAYRSISKSWFEHSAFYDVLKILAEKDLKVVITTDHGTIKVMNPVKVIGDRNTNTNLRYKQGRNLNYKRKEVFAITNPQEAYLPNVNISSTYIFSLGNDFFVYPNNYNYYAKYYKSTFQHGGISLEEMLIPLIELTPKNSR